MKNTFGNVLTLTLFGESHGETIGVVLDGLTPGLGIDMDFILHQLMLRRPAGNISTNRVEHDNFQIISGMKDGKTTGTPLCVLIENEDVNKSDYTNIARPSHADFTANCKYNGFADLSGGGHLSGRLTAPIVAAGAILIDALKKKNIFIGTHIKSCKDVCDRDFADYLEDIKAVNEKTFPVLDSNAEYEMIGLIESAKENGDSVGGVLETVVFGMPCGVGEPWFDTLEGMLSHAIFSIPAVKGVEFGAGFDICNKFGSQANDEIYSENGRVYTKTNNSGGICGGISNGMPVVIKTAIKPTPTIFKEQNTIELNTNKNVKFTPQGRHDPFIAHRARVVADSLVAITLADALMMRFGTDWLR